ncbi:MAG: M6 family metalloprotease domain-containing protein [Campylobacterota bacterium]|nr:M6 family metalloprotease domain-containing protein [Campylobacterota bacterium]
MLKYCIIYEKLTLLLYTAAMKQLIFMTLTLLLLIGCGSGGGSESEPEPIPAPVTPSPVVNEKRPTLVIRIAYNDITFQSPVTTWTDKIFGFKEHQLNSYYKEISMGNFTFDAVQESEGTHNDGIISITLNKNHPDSGASSTIHTDLFQALSLADPYIDVSQYDTNANGAISPDEMLIIFIIAGNEDAHSGSTAKLGVWAHQSCTSILNTPSLDDTKLMGCSVNGNYAMFGERHGNNDATIGIIAHELGHAAFNLPDLYDTTEQSAGLGYFALMSSGMWGFDGLGDLPGNTPIHMCAWSKTKVNWIEPEVISNSSDLHVNFYASSSDDFNIVKIPITDTEYFLLENRHNSGYDRGLEAISFYFNGGLAIWHIDENVINSNMLTNSVNDNVNHKGVDLEEAARAVLDYDVAAYGERENLFYQSNVDSFTPHTSPSSKGYNGSNSNIHVNNISEYGTIMSATISKD